GPRGAVPDLRRAAADGDASARGGAGQALRLPDPRRAPPRPSPSVEALRQVPTASAGPTRACDPDRGAVVGRRAREPGQLVVGSFSGSLSRAVWLGVLEGPA